MSKEFKRYQKEIAGRVLTVDIGRVAAQANGAAFIKLGDSDFDVSTMKVPDKEAIAQSLTLWNVLRIPLESTIRMCLEIRLPGILMCL